MGDVGAGSCSSSSSSSSARSHSRSRGSGAVAARGAKSTKHDLGNERLQGNQSAESARASKRTSRASDHFSRHTDSKYFPGGRHIGSSKRSKAEGVKHDHGMRAELDQVPNDSNASNTGPGRIFLKERLLFHDQFVDVYQILRSLWF